MTDCSLLNKRNLLGYFTSYPISKNPGRVLKPDAGIQLSYNTVTMTDKADRLQIKELDITIRKTGLADPIGYMRWLIFDSRGERVSQDRFFGICDRYSQDLCDFAFAILAAKQIDLEVMFMDGSFAELTRMELHESYLGKGYGILAIREFIRKSCLRRNIHTIFIRPFPLQYENIAPDIEHLVVSDEFEKRLCQATQKISGYFQNQLSAQPLGAGSDYLYVALHPIISSTENRKR